MSESVVINEPKVRVVKLAEIVLDPKAQPRAKLDDEVIGLYSEVMTEGGIMPPLDVFEGQDGIILADGFHRYHAAQRTGYSEIICNVRTGTMRDAIQHASGANATHGMQRNAADRRRAVMVLLEDKEWSKLSDRQIGDITHVNRQVVATIRREAEASGIEQPKKRVNARGQEFDPKAIHRKRSQQRKLKTTAKAAKQAEPEATYGEILIEMVRTDPPSLDQVLSEIRAAATDIPHNSVFIKFASFVENVGFELADDTILDTAQQSVAAE